MNATGVWFGFLILRICDTSLVKGPRLLHLASSISSKATRIGSGKHTVEAELLWIDLNRHVCEFYKFVFVV